VSDRRLQFAAEMMRELKERNWKGKDKMRQEDEARSFSGSRNLKERIMSDI